MSYKGQKKKRVVLGPVSFNLAEGEIAAVLGPSGCGKSTLLQGLAGVLKSDEGKIALNNQMINYGKDAIGYMPQGYGLLPWKTVYQNCLLPYKVKKTAFSKERSAYIDHLLESLAIHEVKHRYPSALSGGQRQRTAIARTLGMKPELLLMDEPFSALDAIMKQEAKQAFMDLWQEVHCTTLIVTHSIEEALFLGKKIIVMGDRPGRVMSIIENPWFGQAAVQNEPAYWQIHERLRQKISEGMKNE